MAVVDEQRPCGKEKMHPESVNVRNSLVLCFVAIAVATVLTIARNIPERKCADKNAECRYDIDALKRTDPRLLIQAGVQFVKPSISNLTALAVDGSDNILVGSKTAIEILDANGVRVGGFDVSGPVRCLAVSPRGEIFVGFKDHVEVYSFDGKRKSAWESPDPETELTSIAVSSNYVFAADYVNRIVWRFSPSGKLLGRLGCKDGDKRKTGFVVPSAFFDVATAKDGSVWVVSPGQHRLEHFTADGEFLASWGEFGMKAGGFCGCCNPSNFALMPDGSFVTSEKHIVRVKIYDPDGNFRGIISGQEEWKKEAVGLDVAVDSKGRILVLDPQAGVVRVYAKK
jgi:hypothetical protein